MALCYKTLESVLNSVSKLGDYVAFMEYLRRQNQTKFHSIELFRFLYIKAFTAEVSPSPAVDHTWHSLLLFPLLYKQVCRLLLACNGTLKYEEGIIPHDPLGGDNQYARNIRYDNTLDQYSLRFPGRSIMKELWPAKYGGGSSAASPMASSSRSTGKRLHEEATPAPTSATIQMIEPASKRQQTSAEPTTTAGAATIKVLFSATCGNELSYRLLRDTPLKPAMSAFALKLGHTVENLLFKFLGSRILGDDSPKSLGLEDGDQIDVTTQPLQGARGSGTASGRSTIAGRALPEPAARVSAGAGGVTTAGAGTGASRAGNRTVKLITINVRDQSWQDMYFTVESGAALGTIMQTFADRKGVSLDVLRFMTVDGRRVNAGDTPSGLGMENEDHIYVTRQQLHRTGGATVAGENGRRMGAEAEILGQTQNPAEQPITVTVRNVLRDESLGEDMFFEVMKGTAMRKIMQAFADRKGVSLDGLRFVTMEWVRLSAEDTPKMLEMEDGDQIYVTMQQVGC